VLDVEAEKKLNISSRCWQHRDAFIWALVRHVLLLLRLYNACRSDLSVVAKKKEAQFNERYALLNVLVALIGS
jgi:hypothetical protein